MENLLSLSNPLATLEQLSNSSSQLDGVPSNLESSVRFAGVQLTQAAGILLRLPQEVIAQAVVIFTRFYVGPDGGSFLINAAQVDICPVPNFPIIIDSAQQDVSAASLYMMAKLSAHVQSPRSVLNVYAYLLSKKSHLSDPKSSLASESMPDPENYYLTEGAYMVARSTLYQTEAIVLRALSFVTRVVAPHHLALTVLQTMGVLPVSPTNTFRALAARTIAHLNTALFSPQLLYLTHQPIALAVAAIYLSAKEVGVKLPASEWWEVFDVDREELGFLVLGFGSCGNWVDEETRKWAVPSLLTVADVEEQLKQRNRT